MGKNNSESEISEAEACN